MLIKNATLIDMKDIFKKRMDLRIKRGKIAEIASNLESEEGEDVLDVNGAIVTPGFVEIHCQIGINNQITRSENSDADDAEPINPCLRAADALDFTDEAFAMARRGGVTTAVCCPGNLSVIGGTCVTVKTGGQNYNERIISEESAYMFSLNSGPRQRFGKRGVCPQTRMGSAALLRDALFKSLEYQRIAKSPKAGVFNFEKSALARVLDGMPVKFAAFSYNDILTAIRIGDEFGLNYIIEGAYDLADVYEEVEERKIKAAIGPLYGKSHLLEEKNRNLDLGNNLENQGIHYAITTWHPKMNIELFPYQMTMLNQKGVSESEILKAATIRPAEYMGMGDRVGSLEYGKDADLLIWDGEPLDYYGKVRTMMIDGKIIDTV